MPELEALEKQGHALCIVPLRPRGEIVHADAKRWLSSTSIAPLFSVAMMDDLFHVLDRDRRSLVSLVHRFVRTKVPNAVKNLAVVPKAAWLAGVAAAWGADHIHAFWASTVASLAMAAAELSSIPWSFTAHRFDIVQDNLLRPKCANASFVRFISESGLRMSRLRGTSLERKCSVLHLGINSAGRFSVSGPQKEPVVALCAAAMVPVKAHHLLIEAAAALRERRVPIELWLAGDGELRNALRLDVHRRGLDDRVKFIGELSHSDLMNLYAAGAVDIAVLSSVDLGSGLHEGIPASLMEAMSFAIPAIGTATGGIPELLGDGAGLLVPPNDASALAEALQLLCENQRLRTSLGRAGLERVHKSFAVADITEQMVRLFSGTCQPAALQAH